MKRLILVFFWRLSPPRNDAEHRAQAEEAMAKATKAARQEYERKYGACKVLLIIMLIPNNYLQIYLSLNFNL